MDEQIFHLYLIKLLCDYFPPLVVDEILMILMETEFGYVDFKTRDSRHTQTISFSYK